MQNIKSSHKSGVARPWRGHQVPFSVMLSIVLVWVGTAFIPLINGQQEHQEAGLEGIRSPDVIECLCNKTRFVDVCISSLSAYPGADEANLWEFGRMAVEVSLKEAQSVNGFIQNLNRTCSASCDPLGDCVELSADTVDQLNDSLLVLDDPNWTQNAGDVRTWLSAALTNLDTCGEGFSDLDVDMPQNMKEKLEYFSQLNSNALAIITYLSDKERYEPCIDLSFKMGRSSMKLVDVFRFRKT